MDATLPVADRITALSRLLGLPGFIAVCTDLLAGAPRERYVAELAELSAHDETAVLDTGAWRDYWLRTWGARGLLHVWDDSATGAVVAGLGDPHWRPAEMCLKVVTAHQVAGAGDAAAALAGHHLSRVRGQALRALAVVGDSEHLPVVHDALDDPDADVCRHAGRTLEVLRSRLDLGAQASMDDMSP